MTISFTKAHGAGNDFLLTRAGEAPRSDLPRIARAICDRHTGVGADGWLLVEPGSEGRDASIRLFNADGSEPELSGNGTRCAAAFLIWRGLVNRSLAVAARNPLAEPRPQGSGSPEGEIRIGTGAGLKRLRLVERDGLKFVFEMNMGKPAWRDQDLHLMLPLRSGEREVTALSVGNPQCAVFVDSFELDWRALGAEIEGHPHFPARTNVSFVRRIDAHSIDVRFYERGVGETMSSGTGSTGAAAAAILRGAVESPVAVHTPAGVLKTRWEDDLYLTGPAEITAGGEFYL